MSSSTRFRPLLGLLAFAFLAACSESPTANEPTVSFAKGGKPGPNTNDCGFTDLRITFRDAVGDALRSDNGDPYVEGVDGGVHLNGATGRLMLWTSQYDPPMRFVEVETTAGSFRTSDRIYTNNHETQTENDAGCGFKAMANQSTGSAVLEAELDDDGIVRYGKACDGTLDEGTQVVTTRSADGLTWTVEGASGVHCQSNGLRGKKAGFNEVGTAGPFFMTLEDITPAN